jgi:hypothetical protein
MNESKEESRAKKKKTVKAGEQRNPSKWDLDVDRINSSTKPHPIPFTNSATIFLITK